VESRHFNGFTGARNSDEHLVLTDRFTRADADTLLYQFTVDDSTAFAQAWTAVLPMSQSNERIFEYACHEPNYALMDILRGARDQERRAGR
jgi:hypothetical protein